MKKIVQITIIVFFLAGCGSIKQGWNNFTAYYNTYHNTKKFYKQGLNKNREQVPDINPLQPIKIYPPPTNAGLDDFEKAIEKGGAILRDHENSKYIAPALFIIGKSYYYRSEYYAALEKFQELEALTSGEIRQQAIFWQGLTFLEMSNYDEGVKLLEYELEEAEDWATHTMANAQVILAQLHVALENWETASQYLENSLWALEDRNIKARTYFLLGQIFERMGEDNRALFAYSQIPDLSTSFDLDFKASRKQAEMSRRIVKYDHAVSLYRSMRRNDKYIEYRDDLQYEIARTLQLKDDYQAAIQNYNEVLKSRNKQPSNLTKVKTYFGLGEIYRDNMKNLKMAAAYFDSAASQRVDPTLISDDFKAQELADSFGEYVTIKQNISEKDSLLNLAAMESEELERFIKELRRDKMEEMEEELDDLQEQRNRMLVAEQEQEMVEAGEMTEYGFLNIDSPTRLADASLQFQAIWGDRPLADNWRRRSAVSGSRFDQAPEKTEEATRSNGTALTSTGIEPSIDLSAIPFEEDEKQEMKSQIEALNYRLGNVFFLSLEMPDSAKTYYKKVIDSGYDENLVTRSLYSIAELELLSDNRKEAVQWYNMLAQREPGSIYSNRIAERLGFDAGIGRIDDQQVQSGILSDSGLNAFPQNSVERSDLIDSTAGEKIQPYLLLQAAKDYMRMAKDTPGFDEKFQQWLNEQEKIEVKKEEFQELKDSSQVMLADTNLTEAKRHYWQQIADSSFSKPDLSDIYPFEGAYWDSTRSKLREIENRYSASAVMSQVQILKETLARPSTDSTANDQNTDRKTDIPELGKEAKNYSSCKELGIFIDVDGGIEAFMSSLSYPSWTNDVTIRGELEYLFNISADGTIQSYKQLSRMDRSGIPQSVEEGFDTDLKFTPSPNNQDVQCTVLFPINL